MMNLRTSIKPLTAAITTAIVITAMSANVTAVVTEDNAKRIKQDYPLKSIDPALNTMAAWLTQTAGTYALNPVNLRGGFHPDRDDPDEKGGDYDVVYIFPDEATANAWWNPTDPATPTPPNNIPDSAVAFIHWELDNGSGSFPGVMSKSDIDGFKSRNCVMAAGDFIPLPGVGEVEKTCSNPQGASKRFKMEIMKHDVPVDLVYNVELAPLTYTNYDTLPTFDGVEESARVYRILQKFHNATGHDTVDLAGNVITRDGERMVGFSLKLGYGVGSAFAPIPDAAGTGLEVDKILGWELRPCMPDHFLDVFRDRPGTGTNPCSASFDSTGQALPQEIWLEEEYSSFSPKMYSTIDDKRMLGIGIPGGFWDKRPAGNYPPAVQTLGVLDSGTAPSDDPVYWDSRVDGATPLAGYVGPTTPNYFDLVANQFAEYDITTPLPPTPYPFGYLMWYGVLADGDVGQLAQGIYVDEDGDPSTEGDLLAWWDGAIFRWSIDGPVFDGVVEPDQAYLPVDPELIKTWALYPLQEEPDPVTGEFPEGPLYEIGVNDDLGGLNIDSFVYLGRNYDVATNPTFTVRLQTMATSTAGVLPGDYGNETPAWVTSPAPDLESFISADGVISIQEPAIVGEDLVIVLGDTDAGVITANTETVTITNDSTGETETVVLVGDAVLDWRFEGILPTVITPEVGTSNDGTLNTWVNQQVTVTYLDVNTGVDSDGDGLTDTNVTKTDSVIMQPPENFETECTDGIDNDGDGLIDAADPDCEVVDTVSNLVSEDGGFCSYNPNGRFDPVLPALVLIGLGYLGLRRKGLTSK